MALEFEAPPVAPKSNILLFGPPKTYKSMGAGSAPGPILYLPLDQPNAFSHVAAKYGDKIVWAKYNGLDTLIDVKREVDKPDHGYETLVIDTIGDLYRLLVGEGSNHAVRPQIGYYGDAGVYIERFVRDFCRNPTINTVFVCHELPVKDEASGTMERLPFTGSKTNPMLGNILAGIVDVVGYTGSVEVEGEGTKFMAQLIPANGRRGGQRWNVLEKTEELDLTDWCERIERGHTDNANKEAK